MLYRFRRIYMNEFLLQHLCYYYYSMKSFSRVQKKGILSARAIENNRIHNSTENFDEMVEKQLEDDFKVFQYLNENPNDGHNTQDYISLFNTLLVKKFNKMRRKQLLKSTKAQFQMGEKGGDSRIWSKSQVKAQNADNSYYSQEQYLKIKEQSQIRQEMIEQKTEQQLQMKRVLIKQITENKKSLNLLKGDIGHMIARNQSISVLQSKVNKVSLVSENQLKRVSMALSKDKEEVQLRQQMQKKFHSKLRSVENIQTRNLKKIKLNYIESMKRRKQIFDNLNLIQKECASIEEYSDKIKIKQQKNTKTLCSFKLLNFMQSVITSSNQLWYKFNKKQISTHQYSQQLQKIFHYEPQTQNQRNIESQQIDNMVNKMSEQSLQYLQNKIIEEYYRLDIQIFEKKKIYNQYLSKIQQYCVKMMNQQVKGKCILKEFYIQERNQLNVECFSIEDYFRLFHHLKTNYNVLYFLIGFLSRKNNNFVGKQLVNQLYSNQCFHIRIQDQQQADENFNPFVCQQIQNHLKSWFNIIKNKIEIWMKIPEGIKKQINKKIGWKGPVSFNGIFSERNRDSCSQAKINDLSEQEIEAYETQQLNSRKEGSQPLHEDKSTKGNKTMHQPKHHTNQEQTAKRIQILSRIDQSYYRMIKQTIQMQKQNTMKNYQFQKTFKRNKYSCQDSLLEQKRFQATFSSLFKQEPDETNKMRSKIEIERIRNENTIKTAFSSMHTQTKSKVFNCSTLSLKKTNTKSNGNGKNNSSTCYSQKYIDKQKKSRLRNKLKDVLSRV